jgi:hypothetical protein
MPELERPLRTAPEPSLAWLWILVSLAGLVFLAWIIYSIGADDY